MLQINDYAHQLLDAGFCVLPCKDGVKHPWFEYHDYNQSNPVKRPSHGLIDAWFTGDYMGLCVLCGMPSDNLLVLDFDDHNGTLADCFELFKGFVRPAVLPKLVIYRTPGNGWRVCWRTVNEDVKRQVTILAKDEKGGTLIEMLACGKVCMTPGGLWECGGKRYEYVQGDLLSVPVLSRAESEGIQEAASLCNRGPEIEPYEPRPARQYIRSEGADWWPSDDYNLRGSWEDLLIPLGWEVVGHRGETTLWRRPDKREGVSATTNYRGNDLLHCFSSSTPLEAGRSYSKFAALVKLEFNGDFRQASRELARRGFGRAYN